MEDGRSDGLTTPPQAFVFIGILVSFFSSLSLPAGAVISDHKDLLQQHRGEADRAALELRVLRIKYQINRSVNGHSCTVSKGAKM